MLDDGGVLLVYGNGGTSDRVLWLRSMVPRSRIELYRRPSYAIQGPPPPYFKDTLNAVVAVDWGPVHEHDVKPYLHKGAPGLSVGAVDGPTIGTLAGAATCGLSHDSVSLCACACDAPRESTAPRADGPWIDDHATRSCVSISARFIAYAAESFLARALASTYSIASTITAGIISAAAVASAAATVRTAASTGAIAAAAIAHAATANTVGSAATTAITTATDSVAAAVAAILAAATVVTIAAVTVATASVSATTVAAAVVINVINTTAGAAVAVDAGDNPAVMVAVTTAAADAAGINAADAVTTAVAVTTAIAVIASTTSSAAAIITESADAIAILITTTTADADTTAYAALNAPTATVTNLITTATGLTITAAATSAVTTAIGTATICAAEDYLLHQHVYDRDRVHDLDCDSSTTTRTLGSTAEACGISAARRDIGAGALAPPAVSRSLRGFELYQGYGYASPVSPSPRSDHAPRMLDDGGVLLVYGNGGISDRVLWLRSMVPRSRIELYRRPSYAIQGPPPPYFKDTLNAVVAVDWGPVHEHDVKPHLHKGAPGLSVGAVDGPTIGTLAGAATCGLSHDSVSHLCMCL